MRPSSDVRWRRRGQRLRPQTRRRISLPGCQGQRLCSDLHGSGGGHLLSEMRLHRLCQVQACLRQPQHMGLRTPTLPLSLTGLLPVYQQSTVSGDCLWWLRSIYEPRSTNTLWARNMVWSAGCPRVVRRLAGASRPRHSSSRNISNPGRAMRHLRFKPSPKTPRPKVFVQSRFKSSSGAQPGSLRLRTVRQAHH